MTNYLIAITGGIAAYKIPLLARLLIKRGDKVRFVLTESAKAFVSPLTLQAISGHSVRSELFDPQAEAAMGHIELARWADVLLIAPATANSIAKLSVGIADDLLSTLYLATTAEIVIAPAMNQQMWQHPATQHNLQTLSARAKHHILDVATGAQACGEFGPGRLLEPETIISASDACLRQCQDYQGIRLTITAGPTQEAIDPVRYLSNHSSGKMGYALAEKALKRGANVTLISGPTALSAPSNAQVIPVVSALEMLEAAQTARADSDIFIGAAAVSDYRIAQPATQKQKKNQLEALKFELVENPDIIATIAHSDAQRPFVVGFAAETENLLDYAQAKLKRKNLDIIIANDVSSDVFGADDNAVSIISNNDSIHLPRQAKTTLADTLLDHILAAYQAN